MSAHFFQRDILKIERENKGGTMTHLALDKVVSDDLKTMRADAMKVVIVVTDGESTKPELTKKSAALLKSVYFVFNFYLSEVEMTYFRKMSRWWLLVSKVLNLKNLEKSLQSHHILKK